MPFKQINNVQQNDDENINFDFYNNNRYNDGNEDDEEEEKHEVIIPM